MTAFIATNLTNYAGDTVSFSAGTIDYNTSVATWFHQGASYDASEVMSFSLKVPTSKSSRSRIRAKITVPIMDAVNTTKKVDELIIDCNLSFPKTSTLAQRRDALAYFKSYMATTIMTQAVEANSGVY